MFFFPPGHVMDMVASNDGLHLCSIADDHSLKVFDVVNFGVYVYSSRSILLPYMDDYRYDQYVSAGVYSNMLCMDLFQ